MWGNYTGLVTWTDVTRRTSTARDIAVSIPKYFSETLPSQARVVSECTRGIGDTAMFSSLRRGHNGARGTALSAVATLQDGDAS